MAEEGVVGGQYQSMDRSLNGRVSQEGSRTEHTENVCSACGQSADRERLTRRSGTAEIARDADDVQSHSRSFVVVPIDAAYDFLLALSSNLTSILNRS